MPFFRVLFASLLCASVTLSADLRTLAGKVHSGELKALNPKEIVIKTAEGEVKVPVLNSALMLDLQKMPEGQVNPPCIHVELTDGSLLYCKRDGGLIIKEDKVTLTLLNDQKIVLPLTALSYALKDEDGKIRDNATWKKALKNRRNHDMFLRWREEKIEGKDVQTLNTVEGSFADKGEGAVLEFTTANGSFKGKSNLLAKLTQAWIFNNKPDPNAPVVMCRLDDIHHNRLVAQVVEMKPGTFIITTVCGAKLEYPAAQVARLDFSKGRLEYISDIEPQILAPEPSEDRLDRYRFFKDDDKRNKNLDGGELKLGGTAYKKGLCLPSPTNLAYKLGGDFKEFSFVLGVDDTVMGNGQTEVIIEGDGRKLFAAKVTRKAVEVEGKKQEEGKPPPKVENVRLNIKDVNTLTIRVRSQGLLDFGNHVDLVDAKINK